MPLPVKLSFVGMQCVYYVCICVCMHDVIHHVHGVSHGRNAGIVSEEGAEEVSEICPMIPVLMATDRGCTPTLFIPEPKNPQVQGTTNSFSNC